VDCGRSEYFRESDATDASAQSPGLKQESMAKQGAYELQVREDTSADASILRRLRDASRDQFETSGCALG